VPIAGRASGQLFIDADEAQIAAPEIGAPVIELHTGRYASRGRALAELERIKAVCASACGG